MKKAPYIWVVLPGMLVYSAVDAAKLVNINDSNFNQYMTQTAKSIYIANHNGQFTLDKTITLPNGVVKHKYLQTYKNVPVYSTSITSTETGSGVQMNWWGNMLTDITDDLSDVTANFSNQEAINKAKRIMKIAKDVPTSSEEAILYVKANEKTQAAELVYLVSFFVEGQNPQRPYVMLNAKTGKVIDKWDGLTTKDGHGPGGNAKTGQYFYGKDYPALVINDMCQMTTTNVDTYNLNGATSGGTIFKFASCPATGPAENTFKAINGAYSPLNDAHFFGNVVYDMYTKWYNFKPLGENVKLIVKVHYGQNYPNAFWNKGVMSFGDGDVDVARNTGNLYPLVSLDVMGHEVSHGVTEKNSGLEYKRQSGGMNEAFSDMAGEISEYYMQSPVGKDVDWMMGASIMKNQTAMRYFANPKLDGRSIDNAKNYNDTLDVHFTSGVYNKAFYTLATKPTWGIRKAFEVFLLANRMYWTAQSTFNEGACGVAKAAHDLGYEMSDVVSSFQVVGVEAGCFDPDPPPVPGKETEILNGQMINNIKMDKDQEKRFFIKVPPLNRYPYTYKYLYINLTDGKSNVEDLAELFIRFDRENMAPLKIVKKDETFFIQYPYAGNYHILLKGKAPATLSLVAAYGN